MSTRDRLMLIGIAAVAVLAAVWMLAVSPVREQASKLDGEVASTRAQLVQAQEEVAQARTSQQRYRAAYASLTSLGMAVPTSQEVPSLIYALDHASNHHKVEFNSITNGAAGSSGGSTSSSASASSASSAAAAGASAPFTQVPFTIIFTGDYQDLIHLLTNLEGFTVQSAKGDLRVTGRLLTIQSIQLGAGSSSNATTGTGTNPSHMSWTIAASAYVLAPTSPSTGTGPAGAAPSPATPASSSSSASVGTPAVIRAGG